MTVIRTAFSIVRTSTRPLLAANSIKNMPNYDIILARTLASRNLSTLPITRNIELISHEKKDVKLVNLKLSVPQQKPLVVMLSWLLAKRKNVHKYANFYLDRGFDVLNINVSPWQLLWPAKGTQVVAAQILKFLELNNSFSPLFLHGFSVGGYLWSEVMVQMITEKQRYQPILDRIVGQVWDSAADITEIPIGVPVAVFPNNMVMQKALRQYMFYHMKTFNKVATCHYLRGSQMFHTNIVKAPALFFVSKTDPVGAESSNQQVREDWESIGIKVTWICFEKSPHVGHFRKYPKEYIAALTDFMDSLQLEENFIEKEKIRAKL